MDKNLITVSDFINAIQVKYSISDINGHSMLSQAYKKLKKMDLHQVVSGDSLIMALEVYLD